MIIAIPVRIIVLVITSIMILAGCASTGTESGMSQEEVRNKVKGMSSTTFAQPLSRVHDAAVRALTTVGCEIHQKQDYFVSGSRPHTFGLIVGSGGETVQIYMLPQSEESTQEWVNTNKTLIHQARAAGCDAIIEIQEKHLVLLATSRPEPSTILL
jgi:hypothetical protein